MDDGRWTMDGSGSPPGGASHEEKVSPPGGASHMETAPRVVAVGPLCMCKGGETWCGRSGEVSGWTTVPEHVTCPACRAVLAWPVHWFERVDMLGDDMSGVQVIGARMRRARKHGYRCDSCNDPILTGERYRLDTYRDTAREWGVKRWCLACLADSRWQGRRGRTV